MTAVHLSAHDIHKSFGEGDAQTKALRGVDLDIDRGDFVAIMGPSGSGKSTLLYCLSGMDHVTEGTVTLHDSGSGSVEITALHQRDLAALRLTRMGFVFQQVLLLRNLTVLDNVVLPGFTATPDDRSSVISRAQELLSRVGIGELADREITQASGGTSVEQLKEQIEVNRDGRTVVLVTHDPNVAARARRVVVLRDGVVDGDLRRNGSQTDDEWAESLAGWLTSHGT